MVTDQTMLCPVTFGHRINLQRVSKHLVGDFIFLQEAGQGCYFGSKARVKSFQTEQQCCEGGRWVLSHDP